MRWRRVLVAVVVVALVGAVVARIWWVNTALPQIPLEYYDTGEWVPLEGAFQNNADEGTDHYSFLLESAEVMTYDQFLKRYGDGTQALGEHGDSRCVVDVQLRIRNDGEDEGGFNAFQMVLVPERANEYLICDMMRDDSLWPQVQQGTGFDVRIRPGTEYVAHIPYVFNGNDEVYYRDVEDRSFTLLASRMPERKMIRVEATVAQ